MLLAVPRGQDPVDLEHQTKQLQSGFIQYLQQKQAAGIVNVPATVSKVCANPACFLPLDFFCGKFDLNVFVLLFFFFFTVGFRRSHLPSVRIHQQLSGQQSTGSDAPAQPQLLHGNYHYGDVMTSFYRPNQ